MKRKLYKKKYLHFALCYKSKHSTTHFTHRWWKIFTHKKCISDICRVHLPKPEDYQHDERFHFRDELFFCFRSLLSFAGCEKKFLLFWREIDKNIYSTSFYSLFIVIALGVASLLFIFVLYFSRKSFILKRFERLTIAMKDNRERSD
jgi:hypothetical protein